MNFILIYMQKLIAFAVLLQTIEMLFLQKTFSNFEGIWRWNSLKNDFKDFPEIAKSIFRSLLEERGFKLILLLQGLSGAVLLFYGPEHPLSTSAQAVLLIGTLLTSIRWRGAFNGGSDSMTVIVLSCLFVANLNAGAPLIQKICVYYVAVQVLLSFFISGIAKANQASWWTGQEMRKFLRTKQYGAPRFVQEIAQYEMICRVLSWGIILFEVSFPLALLGPRIAGLYIFFALIFHLLNVYLIGLNRFFFTWLAAYPALYFCSLKVNGMFF